MRTTYSPSAFHPSPPRCYHLHLQTGPFPPIYLLTRRRTGPLSGSLRELVEENERVKVELAELKAENNSLEAQIRSLTVER